MNILWTLGMWWEGETLEHTVTMARFDKRKGWETPRETMPNSLLSWLRRISVWEIVGFTLDRRLWTDTITNVTWHEQCEKEGSECRVGLAVMPVHSLLSHLLPATSETDIPPCYDLKPSSLLVSHAPHSFQFSRCHDVLHISHFHEVCLYFN